MAAKEMTKEEFMNRFRGRFLLFLTEAWAVRKDSPSDLGRAIDEHHIRLRRLMDEIYDVMNPPPVPHPAQPHPAPQANGQALPQRRA